MKNKKEQNDYINGWLKEHYTCISVRYPSELVLQFKSACKKLGKSQSQVIKEAIYKTIKEAESL